jgi:hypothetical protein
MATASGPACELCEEQHAATHRCLDCRQNMCTAVAKTHLKALVSLDHRVVEETSSAAAATGAAAGGSARPVRTVCEVHKGKLLELYDRQLGKAICV